jgi:LPXTG-site transpeptidase (sortase) family protein
MFAAAIAVAVVSFAFFIRDGGIGGGSDDRSASALLVKDPNVPTVKDLNQLREQYGDPADATYGRILIPSIHVDAPIGTRVVGGDGQMPDPTGPSDVVWYDFRGLPGFGGVPGTGHNAVLAGHVDRAAYLDYAGVNYIGAGIFYSLSELDPGDTITIEVGGKSLRYIVAWVQDVKTESQWGEFLASDVGIDAITLVTCGGEFDPATHAYTKRTLVRATRG